MGKRAKKSNHAPGLKIKGVNSLDIVEIDARRPHFAPLRKAATDFTKNIEGARFAPVRQISLLIFISGIFAILGGFEIKAFSGFYYFYLVFAFFSLLLRSAALFSHNAQDFKANSLEDIKIAPQYSILIALYNEAEIVPNLIANLSKINWPKNKLDIIFLCEANDTPTQDAVRQNANFANSRLVIVPPGSPQTKPRALNYGLALARGRFLTIYDAEDLPHENQLRAAFECFSNNDETIGMIQAPLITNNENESFIAAQFALDYAIWFQVLLPFFARFFGFIPLGGTSNHFRTSVLRKAGGWDPYNLTEDADLGIRLARLGYKAKTINCPTYEESPPKISQWIKQRTRWIHGHLQTIATHIQAPIKNRSELSMAQFIGAFFTIFAGPLFIFLRIPALILCLRGVAHSNLSGIVLLYVILFELLIVSLAIKRDGRRRLWHCFYQLPAYWILQTFAYLRANVRIFTKPFEWEKTAHGINARK